MRGKKTEENSGRRLKNKTLSFVLGLFFVICLFFANGLLKGEPAKAIASQITFQGKLSDSGGNPLPNGTIYLILKIYNASSGGTVLYSASSTGGTPTSTPVTTASGIFSINLGDTSANLDSLSSSVFSNDALYLGVTVCSGAGTGCDAEMTPRKRLTAAPYSFTAYNAENLGGATTSTQGGNGSYIPATDSSGNLKISNSFFAATSTSGQIGIGTSTVPSGYKSYIESTTASNKLFVIRANSSQTGTMTEWQDSAGTSIGGFVTSTQYASLSVGGNSSLSGSLLAVQATGQTNAYMGIWSSASGGYLQSSLTRAGLVTGGDGTVTSTYGNSSLSVGAVTGYDLGKFYVNNSGNVSASGTLGVFGNTTLSGFLSATSNTSSLRSLLLSSLTSAPDVQAGTLYFNSGDGKFYGYTSAGTAVDLGATGSGSGTNDWGRFGATYGALALRTSSTYPVWFDGAVYASSTLIASGNVTLGDSITDILTATGYFANTLTVGNGSSATSTLTSNTLTVAKASNFDSGKFYVDASGNISTSGTLYLMQTGINRATVYSKDVLGDNVLLFHSAGASASESTFFGENSGNLTFSGFGNTGFGGRTLQSLTNGDSNSVFGDNAGYTLTSGGYNTAVGFDAMAASTASISANTAIGRSSLRTATGSGNTALGSLAGYFAGSYNIFLGYGAGYNETGSNKLYIANSDTVNPLIYGEFDNQLLRVNGNVQATGTLKLGDYVTTSTLAKNSLIIGQDSSNSFGKFYVDSTGSAFTSGTLVMFGSYFNMSGSANVNTFNLATTTVFNGQAGDFSNSRAFIFDASNFSFANNDRYIFSLRSNNSAVFSVASNGDMRASGTLYALSSVVGTPGAPGDLSERVDIVSGEQVEPGDVMIISTSAIDTYQMSKGSYEKTVAGVISTNPTIIAGNGRTENTAVMALVGRVPIKATAENGPIKIGDYLVTASRPGFAMKYDIDSGKTAGIIGIASEGLEIGEGKILALVNAGLVNGTSGSSNLNVSQTANGNLSSNTNLDLNGFGIVNISSIKSKDDKWTINEDGYLVVKVSTSKGDKELYGLQTGSPTEIVMSSSSQLENGIKKITFDEIDQELTDQNIPIKVTVTLTGEGKGVYVTEKSYQGFTVKELSDGTSNATFDWMVIAKRRAGVENDVMVPSGGEVGGGNLDVVAGNVGDNSTTTVEVPNITEENSGESSGSSTPILPEGVEVVPDSELNNPPVSTEPIQPAQSDTVVPPVENVIVPPADVIPTPIN